MRHFSRTFFLGWLVMGVSLSPISTFSAEDHSGTRPAEYDVAETNQPTFRFTKDSLIYTQIKSEINATDGFNQLARDKDPKNFRVVPSTGEYEPVDGLDWEYAGILNRRKEALESLAKHKEFLEKNKSKISPEDLPLFNELMAELEKATDEHTAVNTVNSKLEKINNRVLALGKTSDSKKSEIDKSQPASLLELDQSISNFELMWTRLPSDPFTGTIKLDTTSIDQPKMAKEIAQIKTLIRDLENESLGMTTADKQMFARLSDKAKSLIKNWDYLQQEQTAFLNKKRASPVLLGTELPSLLGSFFGSSGKLPGSGGKTEIDPEHDRELAKLREEIEALKNGIITDAENRTSPFGSNLDVTYSTALEKLKEAEFKLGQLGKPKPSMPTGGASAIVGAMFPTLSSVGSALNQFGSTVLGNRNSSESVSPEPKTPPSSPVKEEPPRIAESPKISEVLTKTPPSQSVQPQFTKPSVGDNSTKSNGVKEVLPSENKGLGAQGTTNPQDLTRSQSDSPISDRISSGPQDQSTSSAQKNYGNHGNPNQANNTFPTKDPSGQEKTTSAFEKSFDSFLKSKEDKPSTVSSNSVDSSKLSPNQNQLSTQSPQDFKSGFMAGLLNQNSSNNLNRSLSSASSSEASKVNTLNDDSSKKESTAQSNSKAIEGSDENSEEATTAQPNEGYSVRGKSKTKTITKSLGRKKNETNDEGTITSSNPATFITNNTYYSNTNEEKSQGTLASGRKSSTEDSSYSLNRDGTFSRVGANRSKNQSTDSTDSKFLSSSIQEDFEKVSTGIKSLESEVKVQSKEDDSLWGRLSLKPELDSLAKLLQDLYPTGDGNKSTEITQLLDPTENKRSDRDISSGNNQTGLRRGQKPVKIALASNEISQITDSGNVFSRILSWFGF